MKCSVRKKQTEELFELEREYDSSRTAIEICIECRRAVDEVLEQRRKADKSRCMMCENDVPNEDLLIFEVCNGNIANICKACDAKLMEGRTFHGN